jgi:RNA polymerase sigma factor (sigma-70 family)
VGAGLSALSPAAPADAASGLYERHGSRVLRFCLSRLGNREDAEDATQTTFLNAFGALRRGTVPRAEAAWLLRIAENVCHHRYRAAARRNEAACDPTVLEDVVEAAPGRPDELIHLAAGLESLPERQRLALLLREWQGLSYHEIGAELELSHSAVETLLFRARRGLAEALEQADGRKRRHGLDLASLLGWLKTTVGAGAGLKVAAAVVVAGVAVVPVRDTPAPSAKPKARTPALAAVVAPAPSAAPVSSASAPAQKGAAVQRRTLAAPPKPAAGPALPGRAPVRGGRPAAVEPEPTTTPSPGAAAAPTPRTAEPRATEPTTTPTPAPPAQEPKSDVAPAPEQPSVPVEPPVQLPVPTPPPDVSDVADVVPTLPAPDLPLPDVPLPAVPQLADLPVPQPLDLPAPQLPLPGLP